jgi:tetratricopeptide (TPR) repeat protein
MVAALQRLLDEVHGEELAVLNTNKGYAQVYERIMRLWEEALRGEVVEALWQDGEQEAAFDPVTSTTKRFARDLSTGIELISQADLHSGWTPLDCALYVGNEALARMLAERLGSGGDSAASELLEHEAGNTDAAVQRFEQAVDAAVKLCADSKELRDRIVAMRRQVAKAMDLGGDKFAQAKAKFNLAQDLSEQGAFDEALALYQEANELYTEVRFQYALSMFASRCLHGGLIFAGWAFCYPLLTFCFYYRWAAALRCRSTQHRGLWSMAQLYTPTKS